MDEEPAEVRLEQIILDEYSTEFLQFIFETTVSWNNLFSFYLSDISLPKGAASTIVSNCCSKKGNLHDRNPQVLFNTISQKNDLDSSKQLKIEVRSDEDSRPCSERCDEPREQTRDHQAHSAVTNRGNNFSFLSSRILRVLEGPDLESIKTRSLRNQSSDSSFGAVYSNRVGSEPLDQHKTDVPAHRPQAAQNERISMHRISRLRPQVKLLISSSAAIQKLSSTAAAAPFESFVFTDTSVERVLAGNAHISRNTSFEVQPDSKLLSVQVPVSVASSQSVFNSTPQSADSNSCVHVTTSHSASEVRHIFVFRAKIFYLTEQGAWPHYRSLFRPMRT